jgi:two-component system, chemotaxis family, sensor kinase CheA
MSKNDVQNDMIRVLLVDDSIVIRTLIEETLKTAGFTVLTAADGMEAWELLQNESVQLLVCDTYMPQMDGLELTRLIRSQKRFSKLPIILISGTDADKDRRLGLKYGANAFVSKEKEGLDILPDKIIHILHTGGNQVSSS